MPIVNVQDNAPDTENPNVSLVGDGVVRAHLNDQRYGEWGHFVRSNRPQFAAGDNVRMWGRGEARDATEAESFVIGQLTYLEQKAIEAWYTPRRYQDVLGNCIDYSAGPWAKAVNYKISDQVGVGKRIAPGATDLPLVDQAYALVNVPVELGGLAYEYTVEDLVTSAFLGQPLPESKQRAAVEAYYNHMNVVALIGELNFKGFYSNSNVTAAPTTSAANWNVATADTIISDVITAVGAYNAATKGNLAPRIMVVPLTTLQLLYKPRATTSDLSIKAYLETTLGLTIISDFALETLGSGTSTKRVVFANPNLDNDVLHIPRPIQFLAPQMNGLRVYVPSSYKYAGNEIRRVITVRYMDGA